MSNTHHYVSRMCLANQEVGEIPGLDTPDKPSRIQNNYAVWVESRVLCPHRDKFHRYGGRPWAQSKDMKHLKTTSQSSCELGVEFYNLSPIHCTCLGNSKPVTTVETLKEKQLLWSEKALQYQWKTGRFSPRVVSAISVHNCHKQTSSLEENSTRLLRPVFKISVLGPLPHSHIKASWIQGIFG